MTKLKLMLIVLVIQCVNVYSQKDIKFLKTFTNDIILDKNYAKYNDYIEYFNGYDSSNQSEKYKDQIKFNIDYCLLTDVPTNNRNIKIVNITNNNKLLHEKFEVIKNLKHQYYAIYNDKDFISFVITDENEKIIAFSSQLNKTSTKIKPWYLNVDLTNEFKN